MTAPLPPRRRGAWPVMAPLAWIALASILGLVAALVGDGLPDVMSWIGLSVPVAAAIWARMRRAD